MGITCICGRFHANPPPLECKRCGRILKEVKHLPPNLATAKFGVSIKVI